MVKGRAWATYPWPSLSSVIGESNPSELQSLVSSWGDRSLSCPRLGPFPLNGLAISREIRALHMHPNTQRRKKKQTREESFVDAKLSGRSLASTSFLTRTWHSLRPPAVSPGSHTLVWLPQVGCCVSGRLSPLVLVWLEQKTQKSHSSHIDPAWGSSMGFSCQRRESLLCTHSFTWGNG